MPPCDGRPPVQAIPPTAPDLRPGPGVAGGAVSRDYEHGRLGTLSPLASTGLPAGKSTPRRIFRTFTTARRCQPRIRWARPRRRYGFESPQPDAA